MSVLLWDILETVLYHSRFLSLFIDFLSYYVSGLWLDFFCIIISQNLTKYAFCQEKKRNLLQIKHFNSLRHTKKISVYSRFRVRYPTVFRAIFSITFINQHVIFTSFFRFVSNSQPNYQPWFYNPNNICSILHIIKFLRVLSFMYIVLQHNAGVYVWRDFVQDRFTTTCFLGTDSLFILSSICIHIQEIFKTGTKRDVKLIEITTGFTLYLFNEGSRYNVS